MAYKSDDHGLALFNGKVKIYKSGTWAMKLSQLYRQEGIVRIITYSLPDLDYVKEQLGRRPTNIWLIAHENFAEKAREIKRTFPSIRIATHISVHSKILLISPYRVYISSANFGDSTWHETSIGIDSPEAHDWYVTESFEPLWADSREVNEV